ncbi:MAG: four helix bundle protein [Planctomycetota bacterium]|jgi:four helix bundle protein
MSERDLKVRTNDFAHRCVKMAVSLPDSYLGHHIRKQLIRCSTSVAANYRAACLAQSKASFVAKLSICIEESDETCFWMEFSRDENLMPETKLKDLLSEAKQVTSILIASRKTANKKKN